MKKLVLVLAVAFSASLFSCNNADKNVAATNDSDTVAIKEATDTTLVAAVDSAAADSAAETPAATDSVK